MNNKLLCMLFATRLIGTRHLAGVDDATRNPSAATSGTVSADAPKRAFEARHADTQPVMGWAATTRPRANECPARLKNPHPFMQESTHQINHHTSNVNP